MRCWQGKVLILLTIALAVANAQCFAHCLTEGDGPTTHCHQKPGHCPLQHDLKVGSVQALTAIDSMLVAVETSDLVVHAMLLYFGEAQAQSPPLDFFQASPLPLRI